MEIYGIAKNHELTNEDKASIGVRCRRISYRDSLLRNPAETWFYDDGNLSNS